MDISDKKPVPTPPADQPEGPPPEQDARPATPEELARARAAAKADGRVFGLCGPGDWLGEKPVVPEKDIRRTIVSDVVVAGGGNGGLLAALGAVDEGASVSVVELQPESNFLDLSHKRMGLGWKGGDIGHVNSRWLIERGFGPYNTGEIAYEFFKRTNGHCDMELIRQFVQRSGPMVDRMMEIYDSYAERRRREDGAVEVRVDLQGRRNVTVDYSDMTAAPLAVNHHQHEGATYPIVRGDYKTWPCNIQFYGHQGNDIGYFNKYILYYTQEHGADWFFGHRAVVLDQNAAGDVVGLIAEDVNAPGEYIRFRAEKGVVVATGDFLGNTRMCWSLLNAMMEYGERCGQTVDDWTGPAGRDGIGHRMMCWAGAVMEHTPRGAINGRHMPGEPWGTTPFLQLNCQGKRFYNEAAVTGASGIAYQQPDGIACYVTDRKAWQTVELATLDHGAPNFGVADMTEACRESFSRIEVGNPDGSPVTGMNLPGSMRFPRTVYAARTLPELADFLGYEGTAKETFLREIEHYNELCRSEDGDTDFGKDRELMIPVDEPPFYGGRTNFSGRPERGLATLAGVIADGDLRVSRGGNKLDPIKGLYTCGNCLGNRYGEEYVSPMAGNSIGMAMTHGWIAGQNAAKGT